MFINFSKSVYKYLLMGYTNITVARELAADIIFEKICQQDI